MSKVKSKKSKVKTTIKNLKFYVLSFGFAFYVLSFAFNCYAQEVTILYTGDTHAMLYPCDCPREPDGGIARRSTLVKQLRKDNPDTLLLDSGSFFAGNALDDYSQNASFDRERTQVNFKAMEAMGYDAAAVGDDEFNFGMDFLQANTASAGGASFLSCNIYYKGPGARGLVFKPYLIKEAAGVKFGIIGLSPPSIMRKEVGIEVAEPKGALSGAIEELKKEKVDKIILLSRLNEPDTLEIIRELEGIDIVIGGFNSEKKDEVSMKAGPVLYLRPSWQGKKMHKLSLTIEEGRITDYKTEELRLRDRVKDDPDILRLLPRCFSDANCKKEGYSGICQEPGKLKSRCVFSEAKRIGLVVISSKDCMVCNTMPLADFLKTKFPGLEVSRLYYPEDAQAKKMVDDFGIKGLPAYLLSEGVESEKEFVFIKEHVQARGEYYLLSIKFAGLSYFIDRPLLKDKFDVFISLYHKDARELLDSLKEFRPVIHFLAQEEKGGFNASQGEPEVEEYLRAVCVQKYYPQAFWDYISCRARDISSSWWEECLDGSDSKEIKSCARGQEGKELLRHNIELNKELEIMFGPTYLAENQQIFGSRGVPPKEELKKILKR